MNESKLTPVEWDEIEKQAYLRVNATDDPEVAAAALEDLQRLPRYLGRISNE